MPSAYELDLDPDQEARAREILRNSISVDMCSMGPGGPALYAELPEGLVAERLPESWPPIVRFAVGMLLPYVLTAEGHNRALERYCKGHTAASFALGGVTELELEPLKRLGQIAGGIEWLGLAREAEDFRRAHREGGYVTWGFCQPTQAGLPRDLDRVDAALALGVRSIMLTYNRQDFVGTGCTERVDGGLSHFGVELVEKMNDVGLIVDTSHCGRETTLDACRVSARPVTANHTSAEVVYRHDRAKSDEELRAVADTGGVIGVYAVPFFLGDRSKQPGLDTMLDHIDHIVRVAGAEHVGIGTDWPFMLSPELAEQTIGRTVEEMGFRDEHAIDVKRTLPGYQNAGDFLNIARGLVARGYDDRAISAILGGNFVRVFEDVCG